MIFTRHTDCGRSLFRSSLVKLFAEQIERQKGSSSGKLDLDSRFLPGKSCPNRSGVPGRSAAIFDVSALELHWGGRCGRFLFDGVRQIVMAKASDLRVKLAGKPTLARLRARYPQVQLATLVDAVPEASNWVHEIKFDGYRLLGFKAGSSAELITRNGKNWTESFPSLSSALAKLPADDAVLDMEAVVLDAHGKSGFQSLQSALGGGGNRGSIVAYVFDLLHLNGQDLTKLPLLERKEKLETLVGKSTVLRYSSHAAGNGEEMFAHACESGLEGIISKEANSPYVAGRSKSWLKIKCSLRQEFIIIGYSDAQSGERALGALYLAYRKDGALHYAGKAGTGFTMRSARELVDRLAGISVATPVLSRTEARGLGAVEWEKVHWVKPILLCEVSFTEWTQGGHIRHPSFEGLREDKNADQVSRETPWRL